MRIAVGADHAGFNLKEIIVTWLKNLDYEITDLGASKLDPSDDYPDLALPVAQAVSSGEADKGIIICGSGVGASMVANKVPGVRACLCHDTYSSHQGVEHDDMNVLCLGGRIIGEDLSKEIVTSFLHATFIPEPRFQRRLDKLLLIEKEYSQGYL